MLLKKLTLSGFKSFARTTTLEFGTSVTAIVGPNGSGKSNIAEGVRFVLGEQSIKSLRGKRGVDLIFNGTSSLPRTNRARVSIAFDNTKRVFDIDYDELEITREVFRDGTHQYFINNSKTRLKDIVEMLASVHIGTSGHHIVSQGEADRILIASPKDRKIMVQDALGLRQYQYKRNESERKLLRTRENISHVDSLRREIAPHLKFLEKQIEKIHRAENLRTELKEIYILYLWNEYLQIEREKQELDNKKRLPQKEKNEIEKTISEQEKIQKKYKKESDNTEELAHFEDKFSAIREKKDDLSRRLGRIEGKLEYTEYTKEVPTALASDESTYNIPRIEANKFIEETDTNISATLHANDIQDIRIRLNRLKVIVHDFFTTYFFMQDKKFEQKKKPKEPLFDELQNEKLDIEKELVHLIKEEQTLYNSYRSKKNTLQKDQEEERNTERELFKLRARRTELVTSIELLTLREERLVEKNNSYLNRRNDAITLFGENTLGPTPSEEEVASYINSGEQVNQSTQEGLREKIERTKIRIEEIGGGGEEVTKEYEETKERDSFLEREVNDLKKSADSLEKLIKELEVKIGAEFTKGVSRINKEFKIFFRSMFEGGNASIKVAPVFSRQKDKNEEEEIYEEITQEKDYGDTHKNNEEGIEIQVSIPRKKIHGLDMLSGGERALTSIALLFAMIQVHPPPFLILDETDAALDESNSQKYSVLLEMLSKKTQFIIITHNRMTMAKAGALYGITTSGDGSSRVLSVKLEEAKEIAE